MCYHIHDHGTAGCMLFNPTIDEFRSIETVYGRTQCQATDIVSIRNNHKAILPLLVRRRLNNK